MSRRRSRAAAAGATIAGAAGALLVAACTDVPTGADVPYSLEFENLPFPAVAVGDQLRDTTGVAAPLGAVAFNVDGEPIPDAAIQYLVVGDAARLESGARVFGVEAGDTVRITAVAGEVPSLPRLLWVVPRPDSLAAPTAPPSAATYGGPPTPRDTSGAITVTLLATADRATPAGVRAWVVRYRVVVNGDTLAPNDSSLAWIVDDAGRHNPLDTTDASGAASRRVRVNGLNPAIDDLESVVVSVTPLGTPDPVRGAPAAVVVPVRARE